MGSGKQFFLIQVLGGSLRHVNGIIALLTRIVKGNCAQAYTGGSASSTAPVSTPPPFCMTPAHVWQFALWAGSHISLPLPLRPALILAGMEQKSLACLISTKWPGAISGPAIDRT